MYTHIPVLLDDVLRLIDPQQNQHFVDCTLGGGGYSLALLKAIAPEGKVLSIDLDADAIANFQNLLKKEKLENRSVIAHGNFAQIDHYVRNHKFGPVDGIVADIGLSSNQLDNAGRGISFKNEDELLDMRFDLSSKEPEARFMLNEYSEDQLTTIFQEYGEEKNSNRLARKIVQHRNSQRFNRVADLVLAIKEALPKPVQHKWHDTARRVFQSLRIAVNHELENLETFLPKAFDLLKPGGKMAVVTFHSLEDRMVKNFFKEAATGCVCPIEFPICKCGLSPRGNILTHKPITASGSELDKNSRAKSAKLRVLQKL